MYHLNMRTIHQVDQLIMLCSCLGAPLPHLAGCSFNGAAANLGGALSEEEFITALVEAAAAGSCAFIGDGADRIISVWVCRRLKKQARMVAIIKPRAMEPLREGFVRQRKVEF